MNDAAKNENSNEDCEVCEGYRAGDQKPARVDSLAHFPICIRRRSSIVTAL